jgi:hypothetical protein
MRTVVVLNHSFDPPEELGRATLDAQGRAIISGFASDPEYRDYLQTEGIMDRHNGKNTMVPPSDGQRFLDVLLDEYTGTYVKAQELR